MSLIKFKKALQFKINTKKIKNLVNLNICWIKKKIKNNFNKNKDQTL